MNIAYNKQLPLCASPSSSFWSSLGKNDTATDGKKVCRKPEELCTADPQFEFKFEGPVCHSVCSKGDVGEQAVAYVTIWRYRPTYHSQYLPFSLLHRSRSLC